MLNPRLLRAFVSIADTGSFTLAAERLYMTQSTISQQLGRPEQAVGRELIDRAARPVQATASGERLLGYARRILSLQQEAETLLSDAAGTAAIRIGLPDDIVTSRMSKTFATFSEQHREICLDEAIGWFESADVSHEWPDPVPLVAFPPGGLYRDTMFERIERERRRW